MEIISNYEVFREKCSTFSQRYIETYLSEGQLVCHPFVKDLIFAPCSDEEAKKNDTTICRLYDMMLMSEDGETNWRPFVLAEAREIAAVNEHIYLSDLLFNESFVAHDWMIDGKHDQIIVSEQYMKEHNKPYAPVTPLTNQKLKIKKCINSDFWKKGTPDNPEIITFDNIQETLGNYIDEKIADFPVIADTEEIKMPVFGTAASVERNIARRISAERALDDMYDLKDRINKFIPLIKALGFNMTVSGYIIKYAVAALNKNGIEMNGAGFRNDYFNSAAEGLPADHTDDDEIAAAKKAFFDAYVKNNSCGFTISEPDEADYLEKLRSIELSTADKADICAAAADAVSEKPADRLIFRFMRSLSPADSDAVDNIEEFWFGDISEVTDDAVNEHISRSYLAECRDGSGKLSCGAAQAKLAYSDALTAAKKYHLADCTAVSEIKNYIDELDKSERTYNGTVFDSPAEMEKAMKNELELNKLCVDLSALNAEELKKLRDYIYNMTVDDKTKGKYLLKAKLAMNDCETNSLKQMCLGLPLMKLAEAEELKKKVAAAGFDDTVAKPFVNNIENRIVSLRADELSEKFRNVDTMSEPEIDALLASVGSDTYPDVLKKHFIRRANTAKENLIRKKLDEICTGMDSMTREQLSSLKEKIAAAAGDSRIGASYRRRADEALADFERREVTALFADIAKADKTRLEKLRGIINEGKYPTELTDPYIIMIADRENAIRIAEFTARCDKIPEMDTSALDDIEKELTSGSYDTSITEKYSALIADRRIVIEKAEIAEIAKDITSADSAALDRISEKLSDEKYRREYTEEFFVKIAERRSELEKAEIAEICKNISIADRDELKKISEKISDKKYNKDYTAEYFGKITLREKELDNKEADEIAKGISSMDRAALRDVEKKLSDERFDKDHTAKFFDEIKARDIELDKAEISVMCGDLENMKKDALEKLTADISAKYPKESSAEFIEKIRAKEIELMKSELEALCKNIPSMPRTELSKLKEALAGDSFDKELSAKYIAQIEQREESLIKLELQALCKNIAASDKEYLLVVKRKITESPEFTAQGRSYLEQIDTRLKKLDKEEFDKMMASIEKMNEEELEKFRTELEKRKPTLDADKYNSTVKLIDKRFDDLEKQALEKLCGDISKMSIEEITSALNTIEDEGYSQENSAPYIKRLNDAATNLHVKYLSSLTDNIANLGRPELLEVIKKIEAYKNGCSDDFKKLYVNKVQARIRDVDSKKVEEMCRNLGSMTMKNILGLIEKIKSMDIDESAKKRYVSSCEHQIIHDKTVEREEYLKSFRNDMIAHTFNESHFITPESKVFDTYFTNMNSSFVKAGQFDLPVFLHLASQGNTEEGFVFTLDTVVCKNKNGLITKKNLPDINRFISKKAGPFGKPSLILEENNEVKTELPHSFNNKQIENAAKIMNALLENINKTRTEAKLREMEQNRLRAEAEKAEAEKARAAAEAKKAAPTGDIKPIKPVEPIPSAASAASDVKPIKAIESVPAADTPRPVPPAPAKKPDEDIKSKVANIQVDITVPEIKKVDSVKPAEVRTPQPKASAPIKQPSLPTLPPKPGTAAPAKPAEAAAPPAAPKPMPAPASTPAVPPIPPKPTPAVSVPAAAPKPAPAVTPVVPPIPPKPAPAPASAKPIKMKFCDQCGAKITSSTAKFCSECGNRING